jgi:hypothetical protein
VVEIVSVPVAAAAGIVFCPVGVAVKVCEPFACTTDVRM